MTSATAAGTSYVVWHTRPDPDNAKDEAVFISRVSDRGSDPLKIVAGADPDCLPTHSGGFLSWLRRDKGVLAIYVSTFDKNIRIETTSIVANGVEKLVTRPYLAEFRGGPCLVYSCNSGNGQVQVHTHFIGTGKELVDTLSVPAKDMIVKWSGNQLVAVLETKDVLQVLNFADTHWNIVTGIAKDRFHLPHRFDFGVGDDSILFVAEVEKNNRLATFIINLSNGAIGAYWPFCEYGKFPHVASANGYWLVGWAGGPASSVDQQGKLVDPDFVLANMRVRELVRAQIDKNNPNKKRSELEQIWDATFVPIWAPLWLGLLNENGKCIETTGPLGDGNENWGLDLSFRDGRGLLAWSAAEEVGDGDIGDLKARRIALSAV